MFIHVECLRFKPCSCFLIISLLPSISNINGNVHSKMIQINIVALAEGGRDVVSCFSLMRLKRHDDTI